MATDNVAGKGVSKRGEVSAKRTRSKNGCTECKKSKLKCDEVHPSCSRCLKRGTYCSYPLPITYGTKKIANSHGQYAHLLLSLKESRKNESNSSNNQTNPDNETEAEPIQFIMENRTHNALNEDLELAAQAAQEAQRAETLDVHRNINEEKFENNTSNNTDTESAIDPSLGKIGSDSAQGDKDDTASTSFEEKKETKPQMAEIVQNIVKESANFTATQSNMDFSQLVKVKEDSD